MKTKKDFYPNATGHFLTDCLTYDEVQNTDITELAWEPLEYLSEGELASSIDSVADALFTAYMEGINYGVDKV